MSAPLRGAIYRISRILVYTVLHLDCLSKLAKRVTAHLAIRLVHGFGANRDLQHHFQIVQASLHWNKSQPGTETRKLHTIQQY